MATSPNGNRAAIASVLKVRQDRRCGYRDLNVGIGTSDGNTSCIPGLRLYLPQTDVRVHTRLRGLPVRNAISFSETRVFVFRYGVVDVYMLLISLHISASVSLHMACVVTFHSVVTITLSFASCGSVELVVRDGLGLGFRDP